MAEPTKDELIATALEQARALLGMEESHMGRFIYGYQEIQGVDGNAAKFGVSPGLQVPLHQTVCQLMSVGRVPQLIPDVRLEPAMARLEAVKQGVIGAYVGVPVISGEGTEFGTLCCISGHPEPRLGEQDLEVMRGLADQLGDALQRERDSR